MLPPLASEVYEQWIHRHWSHSPYYGLPLSNLSCRRILLPTTEIVAGIGSLPGGLADPPGSILPVLYDHLNSPLLRNVEPFRSMNLQGTWNFPILAVRSHDGFEFWESAYRSPRWLVEGHQRLRYLKVLASRGAAAEAHAVFELSYNGPSVALK